MALTSILKTEDALGLLDYVLGGIVGHSGYDVNYCNNCFPNGVEKFSLRDGSRIVISGYQAVREIQWDRGREFSNGFVCVVNDLRKSGDISADLQYLYKPVS